MKFTDITPAFVNLLIAIKTNGTSLLREVGGAAVRATMQKLVRRGLVDETDIPKRTAKKFAAIGYGKGAAPTKAYVITPKGKKALKAAEREDLAA